MRKIFQFAALFLLLIGLPAGSWYYLQLGLDYRKETMGQLQDHGAFTLKTNHTPVGEGSVRVINFLSATNADTKGPLLAKLYEQFDKREDFELVTFVDTTAFADLATFRTTYQLEEEPQCSFPSLKAAEWQAFVSTHESGAKAEVPYLALVDVKGNIRNFYEQEDEEAVKQLVEHIAFLLPIKKRDKAELRRETEK